MQKFSLEENNLITAALSKLFSINAIQTCHPCDGQFVSKIFLRDKPNGEKCLIINLKHLNYFVSPPHFKMEDHRTAVRLIHKNMFLATIDIKDAYFTIPIEESYRKYLRFLHHKILYEFTCLPFGFSIAPYCFTKTVRPVVKYMRKNGVICVNYLDDFFLLGETQEECSKSVSFTISLLESLGFVVNYEKSCMFPSRTQKFLGFIFNSAKMAIEITEDKKQKIISTLRTLKYRKILKLGT